MRLRTLNDKHDWRGLRVLVRADLNVPLASRGRAGMGVAADGEARLAAAAPTVEHLASRGARVIVLSHLGRPAGWDELLSLKPVARRFAFLLGRKAMFIDASLEDEAAVERSLAKLKDGEVAVLENIRFYRGEEKNNPFFARRLASLADVFVNDAFATAHRVHASTVGVAGLLPSYAGLLMAKELAELSRILHKPKRPLVALVGGKKIETKLPMLENLLRLADKVLVGGAMANNFFRAQKFPVGRSVISPADVALAKKLLKKRALVIPIDVLVANEIGIDARVRVTTPDQVRPGEYIVDIGPETVRRYARILKEAATIVWNGPVGLFENPRFRHGTVALGRVIAARSTGRAYGAVGGGETIAALALTGMAEHVDHVSTGGGAMLEFLSGKVLPGVKSLLKK